MTEIISWFMWLLDSDILSLCNEINYLIMGKQPQQRLFKEKHFAQAKVFWCNQSTKTSLVFQFLTTVTFYTSAFQCFGDEAA